MTRTAGQPPQTARQRRPKPTQRPTPPPLRRSSRRPPRRGRRPIPATRPVRDAAEGGDRERSRPERNQARRRLERGPVLSAADRPPLPHTARPRRRGRRPRRRVAMARQAALDGIDDRLRHAAHPPRPRRAHRASSPTASPSCAAELRAAGVPVAIVTGGEVAETALGGLGDDDLRLVSLDGAGRWLLLEPAPGPARGFAGATPSSGCWSERRSVVAHPERHVGPDFRERLAELVARGRCAGDRGARAGRRGRPGVARLVGTGSFTSSEATRTARGAGARCDLRAADRALERAWRAARVHPRGAGGDPARRGRRPPRRRRALVGADDDLPARARRRPRADALPSPWRRKFAAPAAAPSRSASSSGRRGPAPRPARPSSRRRSPRGDRGRTAAARARAPGPR